MVESFGRDSEMCKWYATEVPWIPEPTTTMCLGDDICSDVSEVALWVMGAKAEADSVERMQIERSRCFALDGGEESMACNRALWLLCQRGNE